MAWAHLRDFGVSRSPPEDFRRVSYVDEEARRGRAAERVAQQVITGERHLHQRWLTRIWNKAWKELGSELRFDQGSYFDDVMPCYACYEQIQHQADIV